MRKVLLTLVFVIFISTQVNATNFFTTVEHSAMWWEGSISHKEFVSCVENFTPPNATKEEYRKVFCSNADEFFYIALAYGLDPRYVFSLGLSESNYGSSDIAKNKNNIFALGTSKENEALSYHYKDVCQSLFETCILLNQYATEGSWYYQAIVEMGYNPKTIEGQQALYGADSSSTIISIMEEVFPSKEEIIIKIN